MTKLFGAVRCIISVFLALLVSKPVIAEQISVMLPGKISANADYREGDPSLPAVFLLHGFMATHQLNIIQIMADELHGRGFTVVAPTLSLQINNRRAGANCDAVHTHTMESDVDEIAWWLEWLKNKGHEQIIVVGFSTGSLQVAILLSRGAPPYVSKAILVSPAYLAGEPFPQAEEQTEIATAKKLVALNQSQLSEYHLSYCKGDFVAPPNVFLSYKHWTEPRLQEKIEKIPVPHVVIIGGEDHRFGVKLGGKLKATHTRVITIAGASHFFDSPYEFDFLDQFIREVEQP